MVAYRTSTPLVITSDSNIATRSFLSRSDLTEQQEKVIGRGIANPFTFSPLSQGVEVVQEAYGLDKINCSIRDILNTLCYDPSSRTGGERFKNPEYGSTLKAMIHEPVDPDTGVWEVDARGRIEVALQKWEKRIQVTDIVFVYDYLEYHMVYISIYYTELTTSQAGSYVHPFVLGSYPTP